MSDTITGTTVADRYQITGYLRSGRMGDIYVARRLEDGQRVSIKLLDPALFYNPEAVKRFARESRITRSIHHPASMQVLDVGRDEIGPYLVMEYVEGDFLSDVLAENGPLEPLRAARIVARIALALEAAHGAGVVHRDLASANVLLASQDGHQDIVKVTDFGLSQLKGMAASDEDEELTAVGVRIGTPSYMAPEYIQDFELDHRADIYGLGVMLYEMLVGHLPFEGRPYAVMEQHVHADRPRPSSMRQEVPSWLDDLVVHMMAIDPNARVQSAREVVTLVELGLKETIAVERYVATTAEPSEPRPVAVAPQASNPALTSGPTPLDGLIESHLRGAERVVGPAPDPSRMFVVARVARTSVASRIGVSPGWRVHLPNEDAGTGLLDPSLPADVAERRYLFFPPGGAEPLGARTSGIDLGVQLLRSPDNVAASFNFQQPDADALLDLWRQARWALLEELALRTISGREDVEDLRSGSAFASFLGTSGARYVDHPAMVLLGAAQYEQGRRAEGFRLTQLFLEGNPDQWPSVYRAVAELYAGLGRLAGGDRESAVQHFARAARTGWLARAVARYQESAKAPLHLAPRTGRELPEVSFGEHSIQSLCGALPPSGLLTLCVLGAVRGNLDYNALVHRYMRFARHLPEYFVRMLVVTSQSERDARHPEHYAAEEVARASGLSLEVVIDERAAVHRALQPGTVPTCYVLNAKQQCVHQGALTTCDAWDALARAAGSA